MKASEHNEGNSTSSALGCSRIGTGILWALIAAYAIASGVHYVYWIANPFPNEFREGAGLGLVHLLNNGVNPYAPDAPGGFFYMYGFLNGWLSSGLTRLSGWESMFQLRMITVACTLLAGMLVASEVRKHTRSALLAVFSFLLMQVNGWVFCEATARPDQLGLLLGLAALYIAGRHQGTVALLLSAVLSVAAFFCKQYFLLIGVEIFVFLLFVSKLRAIGFGVLLSALLLASLVGINAIYPSYFTMTVLAFGGGHSSFRFLLIQYANFVAYYWPLLVIIALSFFWWIRQVPHRLSLFHWRRPLFERGDEANIAGDRTTPDALVIYRASFLLSAAALLLLGLSDSAIPSYFYQLLLPSTIVLAMCELPRFCPPRWRVLVLTVIGLVSLLHYDGRSNLTRFLTQGEKNAWIQTYAKLDSVPAERLFLKSQVFEVYAIRRGVRYYSGGHATGQDWTIGCWDKMSACYPALTRALFGEAPALGRRYRAWQKTIDAGLQTKQFDLVVMPGCERDPTSDAILLQHYRPEETVALRSGSQQFICQLWRPKN
jgi:hypothetical protein